MASSSMNRMNSNTRVPVQGVLSSEGFIEHLHVERARVDRSGSAFTLIVFTLEGYMGISQKKLAEDALLEALMARTRTCDAKGWHGDQLAVILPYTHKAQAEAVIEPLNGLFKKIAATIISLPPNIAFSCVVYGYPEDELSAMVNV